MDLAAVRPRANGFCAVAAMATTILHELTHALGDDLYSEVVNGQTVQRGANHEWEACTRNLLMNFTDPACWDEARMVGSALRWALAQRYTCMTQNAGQAADGCMPCTELWDDDDRFLNNGQDVAGGGTCASAPYPWKRSAPACA